MIKTHPALRGAIRSVYLFEGMGVGADAILTHVPTFD